MKIRFVQKNIEFNENILISSNNKLFLYSIIIDSFSIITVITSYEFDYVWSDLIKAEDRLYFVNYDECWRIFESGVEDEYNWKKIGNLMINIDKIIWNGWCLYNNKSIYISDIRNNMRLYQKFCLDQTDIVESSIYTKHIAIKSVGRMLEAIKRWNQAYKLNPNYTAYINEECTLSDIRRRIDEIEELNEKIKNRPCFESYFNKANRLIGFGIYLEAIKCYNEAIKFYPTKDNHGDSLKDIDSDSSIEENYRLRYVYKANAFKQLGKFFEARECLNEAIELHPYDYIYYINKWNTLELEYYNEAIQCAPDDPLLYFNRAKVFNDLEKEKDALKDLNRADDLMKKNIQERYISDYAEENLYEDNSIIFDKIQTVGIELLKKIIRLQESAIKFTKIL